MSRRDDVLARRRVRFTREILAVDPTITDDDLAGAVEDAMQDAEHEEYEDLEYRRSMGLLPEELPSIPNCDDAGTGEGRYHGRM